MSLHSPLFEGTLVGSYAPSSFSESFFDYQRAVAIQAQLSFMYRAVLHTKIGNLLAFLAQEVPNLALTKALKLLYLIDEASVNETGVPVTWLDHKVWKLGPVADEVYREIRFGEKTTVGDTTFSLEDFISWESRQFESHEGWIEVAIRPKQGIRPDLMVFSEFEEGLVRRIVGKYRYASAQELIRLLHAEDTLWHRKVNDLELGQAFKFRNTSSITIDFNELIKDDELKMMAGQAAHDALEFESTLSV